MTKMSKRVIIIKGQNQVFETIQDAAIGTKKSASTISRSLRNGSPDMRWVDRVYMIKVDGIGWRVGVLNATNTAYFPMCQEEYWKISVKKVKDVKDVTLVWYGF